MEDLPRAVLFSCTLNSVRSPMAEGLLKHFLGHRIYVDSAGVRARVLLFDVIRKLQHRFELQPRLSLGGIFDD